MEKGSKIRSHKNQIIVITGLLVFVSQVSGHTASNNSSNPSEAVNATRNDETVAGGLKIIKTSEEQVFQAPEIFGDKPFTLKTDPTTGQLDFNMKTVDISLVNQQKNKENAEKAAIVQQDLQSRIKLPEETSEKAEEAHEEFVDPKIILEKNAKVKEDIESRVMVSDDTKTFRIENDEYEDTLRYPIKRADVDYYEEEPAPPPQKPAALQSRTTTEAPKEEDSFFSIFESLFGGDDEPQTKKKASPEDGPLFKESDDLNLKDIKNVGEILKPIRADEPTGPPKKYENYEIPPEHRIINDFRRPVQPQPPKSEYRPHAPLHNSYHNYPRPVPEKQYEKPYLPYRPYPTPGYEDYDLEEFMGKDEQKPTTVKHTTTTMTSTTTTKAAPTTTFSTTTTMKATPTTTVKVYNYYENTPRNPPPIIQKKNDYIEEKIDDKRNEITEAKVERVTEKAYLKTKPPPTTSEKVYYQQPEEDYETKSNEVKSQNIQDSANFYNLINLPVRYSTKDTAIPLISTSYANTKIQGLSAHKYEKNNGKYPNHKYDPVSTTTKKPNYWSARRTTPRTYQTPSTTKATPRYPQTTVDLSDLEYDDMAIGSSADFGGYGHKAGVEVKTQPPVRRTDPPVYKETTTRRHYDTKDTLKGEESNVFRPNPEKPKEPEIKTEKTTSVKPEKESYDDYEYENYPPNYPAKPTKVDDRFSNNQNQEKVSTTTEKKKLETTTPEYKTTQKTTTTTLKKPAETPEYEYYDYDENLPTTTPKYKLKYPSIPKEIINPTSEKVAVVVPSKIKDFYEEEKPVTKSTTTTTTTTTTSTTTPRTTTEEYINFQINPNQFNRPNHFNKEPAPVFEDDEESDGFNSKPILSHLERQTTTQEPKIKPIIVTAGKDQENNVNIVLVPTKDTGNKKQQEKVKTEQSEIVQNKYPRPNEMYHRPNFEYTTEFTVGAVQGHGGPSHGIPVQGHFVATSMSASPFGDSDEPFRPIARPPGMTASFQVIGDESELRQPQGPQSEQRPHQDKRPGLPPTLHLHETEPIHEPHEFVPSPQFHRPKDPKPVVEPKPEFTLDYDVDEIQTEPKPGQYVIFSKPQLNPEMNENQLKKKPEVNLPTKPATSIPHFHESGNQYNPENQKPILYHPKPNPYVPEAKPQPEKTEQKRPPPNFNIPEKPEERPSLQLTPPKGTQTEEPFEGNFVIPKQEKPENAANYPRPHWEKNGKPGFLLNKNEIPGNRQPPIPPQMAPTLIPPSNIIPQRFRKPIPPNLPPIRKNFNEGNANGKPKPNLPNILPQFRPNAKIGSGPYQRPFHRPPGYHNGNRRNGPGPNRYHEKENGNFPYHIQHPVEKDTLMHRDFEVEPGAEEIVPKFITTRGKVPNEIMDPYGMQKRYGMVPPNAPPKPKTVISPPRTIHDAKVLRRLQRTPVTTLQMLQQKPGTRTHKTPIRREDNADPSVPLVPPVYKPYHDGENNQNLYVVYPTKTQNKYSAYNPPKRQPNIKIENPEKFTYNFTKTEDQYPLLPPTKRPAYYNEKPKNEFPYGFVKPDEKLKLVRKYPEEKESSPTDNIKMDDKEVKPNLQDYMPFATKKPIPSSEDKDEKIDMNLHMQSNNQWNKVVSTEEDINIITQSPIEITKSTEYTPEDPNTPFRITDYPSGSTQKYAEIRVNPPSEYHTSIKDENNSAFTLGAVMHTVPESGGKANKKGQVTSVSLHDDEELVLPNLNPNERISNGKIITVSMPLDVKEEPKEEPKIQIRPKEPSLTNEQYQFQAPFQASSSVSSNEAEPTNQGWSIVKNPSDPEEKEDKNEKVEGTTNNTFFNPENFQPELQGGFKPIYELPEDGVETDRREEIKDREERSYDIR